MPATETPPTGTVPAGLPGGTTTGPDRSHDRARPPSLWLLVTIAVILIGWALHATGAFMVPVVFSVFLALLVAPLDRGIAKRVPDKVRWLGHVAAMGAILVALVVFVGLIWVAAQQVVERFPFSGDGAPLLPEIGAVVTGASEGATADAGEAAQAAAAAEGAAPASPAADSAAAGQPPAEHTLASRGLWRRLSEVFSGAGGSLAGRLGDWASGIASQVLSAAGTTLGMTVLVFFLTLLMLSEGPNWREKMTTVLDAPARRNAMDSVQVIGDRLRRYLLARTVLGLITAVLYGVWLWLFGVDLLVVWALLAYLLNYIPTLGSLVAGVLPVLYAFVQKDLGSAVAVGTGIFVIEQVMGNYIDPRVQGQQVSLSPLVVLITLLVWGWIWGIAGAILAVPITIAGMIICAHVGPLRPFALMLSNASDLEALDRQATGSKA